MITWMQRHKKWLIITIWISTIAFVGAGFVGWGQYSYGDKAGAIAKVGSVEISMGELQKNYSNLYAQYNQMFQGNFDEEKAKRFGLEQQALNQLIQQALILNLAKSYDLRLSDKELLDALRSQEHFFKDGMFDPETYRSVLSQNRLTVKEYETALKKELLIMKTLSLFPIEVSENEKKILTTTLNIADKINYKVISHDDITVESSDEELQKFWESKRQNFMTEVSYEVEFITEAPTEQEYSEQEIEQHYSQNKTHFKDAEGKILSLENAHADVIRELNEKATKERALRAYIDYKKGELDSNIIPQTATISKTNNPFSQKLLEKISTLTPSLAYLKPLLHNGVYYTFKLLKTHPSQMKTFQEAKAEALPLFIADKKQKRLLELANDSIEHFNGDTTEFLKADDAQKLQGLTQDEADEFLSKLFASDKKRSFIQLNSSKIVLYNILEQKLLGTTDESDGDEIARLKSTLFNSGLIERLQDRYKTETFMQGL